MQAIANALCIQIEIIQSDGHHQTIKPRETAKYTIYVGYEVGIHYQSLIPQSDPLPSLLSYSVVTNQSSDEETKSRLLTAVKNGDQKITFEILGKRSDLINLIDREHQCSLLMWAVIQKHTQLAELLTRIQSIDLGWKSKMGRTVIHFAARHGDTTILQQLINLRPELVNQQDDDGMTPMHLAVRENHIEVVRFLSALPDVKINIKNKVLLTPLELAQSKNLTNIIEVLSTTDTIPTFGLKL